MAANIPQSEAVKEAIVDPVIATIKTNLSFLASFSDTEFDTFLDDIFRSDYVKIPMERKILNSPIVFPSGKVIDKSEIALVKGKEGFDGVPERYQTLENFLNLLKSTTHINSESVDEVFTDQVSFELMINPLLCFHAKAQGSEKFSFARCYDQTTIDKLKPNNEDPITREKIIFTCNAPRIKAINDFLKDHPKIDSKVSQPIAAAEKTFDFLAALKKSNYGVMIEKKLVDCLGRIKYCEYGGQFGEPWQTEFIVRDIPTLIVHGGSTMFYDKRLQNFPESITSRSLVGTTLIKFLNEKKASVSIISEVYLFTEYLPKFLDEFRQFLIADGKSLDILKSPELYTILKSLILNLKFRNSIGLIKTIESDVDVKAVAERIIDDLNNAVNAILDEPSQISNQDAASENSSAGETASSTRSNSASDKTASSPITPLIPLVPTSLYDMQEVDRRMYTFLFHHSNSTDSTKIAELETLLLNGAQINLQLKLSKDTFTTPLHLVGSLEIAQLLLKYGANTNVRDSEGRTPSEKALSLSNTFKPDDHISQKFRQIADILATAKTVSESVHANEQHATTPEITAQLQPPRSGSAAAPIEKPTRTPVSEDQLSEIDKQLWYMLHLDDAEPRAVLDLIEQGADVNIRVWNLSAGWHTPLHLVRTPEIAQILIDHGADPSVRNSDGNTPKEFAQQKAVLWRYKKDLADNYNRIAEILEQAELKPKTTPTAVTASSSKLQTTAAVTSALTRQESASAGRTIAAAPVEEKKLDTVPTDRLPYPDDTRRERNTYRDEVVARPRN